MILDCRMTSKTKKRVADRVSRGVCLACDAGHAYQRGVCAKCYTRWYRERQRMTARQAAIFDLRLVRKGLLLAANAVRSYRSSNVFRRVAKR